MGWVLAALIVVVIGFAFLASVGRLGQLAAQIEDRPSPDLPADRPLTSHDLHHTRFAVVARGYSMEQVDAVLDRVAEQLDAPAAPQRPAGPMRIGWPADL